MVEKLKIRRYASTAENSFSKVSFLVAVVSISQGKGLRAAAHKPRSVIISRDWRKNAEVKNYPNSRIGSDHSGMLSTYFLYSFPSTKRNSNLASASSTELS